MTIWAYASIIQTMQMNPETRARIQGMREGIVRVQEEFPDSIASRFHDLELGREIAQIRLEEASLLAHSQPNNVTGLAEMYARIQAGAFDRAIRKGPGIRRELIVFNFLPLPWFPARRRNPAAQDSTRLSEGDAETLVEFGFLNADMPRDVIEALRDSPPQHRRS